MPRSWLDRQRKCRRQARIQEDIPVDDADRGPIAPGRRTRADGKERRSPLSYASHFVLPLTRKAGFRPAGWPLPGGRRTLWIASKGFRSLTVILLSCSPDARLIDPRPNPRGEAASEGLGKVRTIGNFQLLRKNRIQG